MSCCFVIVIFTMNIFFTLHSHTCIFAKQQLNFDSVWCQIHAFRHHTSNQKDTFNNNNSLVVGCVVLCCHFAWQCVRSHLIHFRYQLVITTWLFFAIHFHLWMVRDVSGHVLTPNIRHPTGLLIKIIVKRSSNTWHTHWPEIP